MVHGGPKKRGGGSVNITTPALTRQLKVVSLVWNKTSFFTKSQDAAQDAPLGNKDKRASFFQINCEFTVLHFTRFVNGHYLLNCTTCTTVSLFLYQCFLWSHWYPCFGLLVISALGFKARVDFSLARFLACAPSLSVFYTVHNCIG